MASKAPTRTHRRTDVEDCKHADPLMTAYPPRAPFFSLLRFSTRFCSPRTSARCSSPSSSRTSFVQSPRKRRPLALLDRSLRGKSEERTSICLPAGVAPILQPFSTQRSSCAYFLRCNLCFKGLVIYGGVVPACVCPTRLTKRPPGSVGADLICGVCVGRCFEGFCCFPFFCCSCTFCPVLRYIHPFFMRRTAARLLFFRGLTFASRRAILSLTQ